jgi:ACR3 family arsenite efflux pump ArsB
MVAHACAKYFKFFNKETAPSTFIEASNFFKLAATVVLILLE